MADIDYALPFPVKGQAFMLSGLIKNYADNNALTGGLTDLAATIAKDYGSFVSTSNVPVEIDTSGWWTLVLDSSEMDCNAFALQVTASNSGAMDSYVEIKTLDLSQFVGRWDQQDSIRFEQMIKQVLYILALYGATQEGALLTFFADDGVTTQNRSTVQAAQLEGIRTEGGL